MFQITCWNGNKLRLEFLEILANLILNWKIVLLDTHLLFTGCQTIMRSARGTATGAALTVEALRPARETTEDFMATDISEGLRGLEDLKKQECK